MKVCISSECAGHDGGQVFMAQHFLYRNNQFTGGIDYSKKFATILNFHAECAFPKTQCQTYFNCNQIQTATTKIITK